MSRPPETVDSELPVTWRYIDIGHVIDRLSNEQIKTILLATEAHQLESVAVAALVPEGYNLAALASAPQRVPPGFSVAANDLDRVLHDQALRDHLDRGDPVVVVFEAFDDWLRLHFMVSALCLDDEEARLDHADAVSLDEADEARWNHDFDHEPPEYEEEPCWDEGQ